MPIGRRLLATGFADRRSEPRFNSSLRVEVEPTDGPPLLIHGDSTNISRHGVAMILRRPLVRGERVLVILENPETGHMCERFAHTRHCRRAYGGYMTGCEFEEPLTEAQLDRLMTSVVPTTN